MENRPDCLLYGAAYYTEYLPYERLETDMEWIAAAGLNVIRIAESTWSTLEKREGEFDFTHIDTVLDAAERHGLSVIIGTPTYAVPSWLVKKDPDVLIEPAPGQHALYGARQNMNIVNPTYRQAAERMIRTLIPHVASRKCVIGFQIDNETKHYGTAGPQVQHLFVDYLKKTCGTPENLNRTFGLAYWSNAIADWDDFPDIRGTINGGLSCEFEKFRRRLADEFLLWQAQLVREYKRPDQFITHNLDFEWKKFGADIAQDGYSYGVQPGIDHDAAASALTLAGTDIYHWTQDRLTGAEISFGGDEIRALKGQEYIVLETQAQAFKYWQPYPGQLRLHAFSHVANGAAGVLYWNWHSIHNSFETYWKGILSHDLAQNEIYREIAGIGAELKKLADEVPGSTRRARTAVLVSNDSLAALKWFPTDRDLSYNDTVRWMYDSLYEINAECDIVFPDAELSGYDLVVTPALYSAPEALIARLRRFVQEGGVLVSSYRSFFSDEHLSVYPDSQPHGMTDCFGITYDRFTCTENVTVGGEPAQYWMELLRPAAGAASWPWNDGGADGVTADGAGAATGKSSAAAAGAAAGPDVLERYGHRCWGAYAAITRHAFGQGTAYYVGAHTSKDVLKRVLRDAAAHAGIALPAQEWPIIRRTAVGRSGRTLHYLLHYAADPETMVWEGAPCEDLLTGETIQTGQTITLGEWGVRVLREKS